MANHLDLEEQEQLDQLKHFWSQYGNLISWLLVAVFGTFAAWNGYQYWQRSQATQAAAMFDEVQRVVQGGDTARAQQAFEDMRERFASTLYAQQAGLLVAKVHQDAGKGEEARKVLDWVVNKATDPGLTAIGRLRTAALQIESKAYQDALQTLEGAWPAEFSAMQADRRGDVYMLQGKRTEAKLAYEVAYKDMDSQAEYRRLVESKLLAVGGSIPIPPANDKS